MSGTALAAEGAEQTRLICRPSHNAPPSVYESSRRILRLSGTFHASVITLPST